ncbi:MAG TPA: hypothetical protein VF690_17545 [Hymenobacter sp.]|jgi:hypothetical protein
MQAVDDHSVIVNVNAVGTDQQFTAKNEAIVGGAFMGNTVNPSDKTTQTNQTVIPAILGKIDGYFNKPGATTLHEVTESYIGGKMSQTAGVSSGASGTPGSVFQAAHDAASPQGGAYSTRYFDKQGNPMSAQRALANPSSIGQVDRYVQEGNRKPEVIQTQSVR